jgi:hypothetical protein
MMKKLQTSIRKSRLKVPTTKDFGRWLGAERCFIKKYLKVVFYCFNKKEPSSCTFLLTYYIYFSLYLVFLSLILLIKVLRNKELNLFYV